MLLQACVFFLFFVCVSLALERSVRHVSHGYRWNGEVPVLFYTGVMGRRIGR